MVSCVDIHWSDRILCNFIHSQWFDGLKANALGIGIGIGIAVNDSQQSNGMSSDPIRSDSSQYTLSSFPLLWIFTVENHIQLDCSPWDSKYYPSLQKVNKVKKWSNYVLSRR